MFKCSLYLTHIVHIFFCTFRFVCHRHKCLYSSSLKVSETRRANSLLKRLPFKEFVACYSTLRQSRRLQLRWLSEWNIKSGKLSKAFIHREKFKKPTPRWHKKNKCSEHWLSQWKKITTAVLVFFLKGGPKKNNNRELEERYRGKLYHQKFPHLWFISLCVYILHRCFIKKFCPSVAIDQARTCWEINFEVNLSGTPVNLKFD